MNDDGSMSDLSDEDFKPIPKALRRSWIWNHGKLFSEFNHGKRDPRWSCDRCANTKSQCSWSVTSSTWIAHHLKAVHKIMKVPALMPPIPPQMLRPEAGTTIGSMFNKSRKANLPKFRHDLTKWIAVSRQAFLVIEEPVFQEMIADLSVEAASIILKSANTVREWVIAEFRKQKEILTQRFQQARSRIHLSMDIWTAPSGNRAYLGIVAH